MTTILCFGDSNTHGTVPIPEQDVIGRYAPEVRWPGVMAAELGCGFRVIEEGLPGRTTVHDDPIEGDHMNGLTALPMLVGSHAPLDVVVLMLGTNDLKSRFSVTAADIAASLERLVTTLHVLCAAPGRTENGGEEVGHGSGGPTSLRGAQWSSTFVLPAVVGEGGGSSPWTCIARLDWLVRRARAGERRPGISASRATASARCRRSRFHPDIGGRLR